jgi:hypothetical protein
LQVNYHVAMRFLTSLLLGAAFVPVASAQYVTGIWTDYDGFWTSARPTISTILPDTSHMLLAFTVGGNTYSTGVDDAKLVANGVSFEQARFRGLDIAATLSFGVTQPRYHMGAMCDGDLATASGTVLITVDGVTSPLLFSADPAVQQSEARRLFKDGLKGLNLGTGMVNIPNQTIELPFPASGVASGWNDGEPELLLTQTASPNLTSADSVCLLDASGNPLGSKVALDWSDQLNNRVGRWKTDQRERATGAGVPTEVAQNKPIQIIGLDFADFGITQAEAALVAKLAYDFNTLSDFAFVAYNQRSFVDCATAAVTLSSITPIAATTPSALDGEMVPTVSGGTSPYTLRQSGTSTLLESADWDSFRPGVYMMEAVDDLHCASTAALRVLIPNVSCAP